MKIAENRSDDLLDVTLHKNTSHHGRSLNSVHGGASWRAWRARLARLRESEGIQEQGPRAGSLGDAVPQKLVTFSQLKDPKSLL